METGKQTTPLPLALQREEEPGPYSPCGHNTNQPEPRTSKQPHKNTTQRVCLRHLRSCDSRPGALRLGPWQSNVVAAPVSFDRQPIRGSPSFVVAILGGSGHLPDWLSPCCSPICPPAPYSVTTGLSFTLLQPPLPHSLSPPARWDQTHARCLINTKTCQRCLVRCKASWETSSYHTDLCLSQTVQGGTRQAMKRTNPTKL